MRARARVLPYRQVLDALYCTRWMLTAAAAAHTRHPRRSGSESSTCSSSDHPIIRFDGEGTPRHRACTPRTGCTPSIRWMAYRSTLRDSVVLEARQQVGQKVSDLTGGVESLLLKRWGRESLTEE
eukprot:963247-Pyramimonas_sp.AAC.1